MIMPTTHRSMRLLPNRKDHDLGIILIELYEKGVETCPDDSHNRLRSADYFVRAILNTGVAIEKLSKLTIDQLDNDIARIKSDTKFLKDKNSKTYFIRFKKRVESLKMTIRNGDMATITHPHSHH
jgi:hypothetical protein